MFFKSDFTTLTVLSDRYRSPSTAIPARQNLSVTAETKQKLHGADAQNVGKDNLKM